MDPREKVLRDYFRNLKLSEDASGRVEKVNLCPTADQLFLDMDRVIQLGELNKKYKDHYLGIDDFVTRLLEGRFSVGSGLSLKLKDLNGRVETLLTEFEQKTSMEEDIIEADIDNLKELLFTRLGDYLDGLKGKLKTMLHETNSELKESLLEAQRSLKEQLLKVINTSEFFDKNKFFVEFDNLKKAPLELEKFLKDYVNNEKSGQFTKNLEDKVRKLGPAFCTNFSIDDSIAKYVLCVEKLDFKGSDTDPTESVLDKFTDHIVQGVDAALKRSRHFVRGEEHGMYETSSKG